MLPHVRAHYRRLSVDALLGSVLDHYRALWPTVEALIRETIDTPGTKPLVLEGSALLPSSVARLGRGAVGAIWLVADDQTIAARIHAQSGYSGLAPERRALVETFVALAQRVNALVVHDVAQMNLPHLAVDGTSAVTSFADMCWLRMRPMPSHL